MNRLSLSQLNNFMKTRASLDKIKKKSEKMSYNYKPEKLHKHYLKTYRKILGQCVVCGRPIPNYYFNQSFELKLPSLSHHNLCLFWDEPHFQAYASTQHREDIQWIILCLDKIRGKLNTYLAFWSILMCVLFINLFSSFMGFFSLYFVPFISIDLIVLGIVFVFLIIYYKFSRELYRLVKVGFVTDFFKISKDIKITILNLEVLLKQ